MNEEPDEQDPQPKDTSSPDEEPAPAYKDTDIPGAGVGIVVGTLAADEEVEEDEDDEDDDEDDYGDV
jgi:hypothetical protein